MGSSIRVAMVLLAVALICHCSDNPTKPNSTPVLSLVGSKSVEVGQILAFTITATDPDGTIPTIKAVDLPTHADFTDGKDGTGLFSFTPDTSQAGQYDVIFMAADGELADSETVTITVVEALLPVNHAPVLTEIGSRTVRVGDTLRFILSATDPDSTTPTISAVDLPANSSLLTTDSGGSVFTFYPDTTQVGEHNVLFYATDGEMADSEIVTITVIDAGNQPPSLTPIGPKSVSEGQSLTFTVSATDPEGTTPSLSAFILPLNATATDSGNGRMLFAFNPDYTQAGVYSVTFVASDGNAADSESVNIEVLNTNRPPMLAQIDDAEAYVDSTLSILISATDPDGTIPSLGVVNAPENSAMTTSDGTARFVFTPDSTQIGVYELIFLASDGELADSQMVTITVSVYEKSVGELWPMAVGNYWVYETRDWHQPEWTLDSIHVQSSYQSDGVTHWRLNHFLFRYTRDDIAIRNDSIIIWMHNVATPPVWPVRVDSVPAGVFGQTYRECPDT